KTDSAFVTLDLARSAVNVLSTYVGATLTKMTLVPNSSLGIQNTSSLLTGSSHLRARTVRDPNRPHVVDSRPRIDQTWLIAVWTRHMEKPGRKSLDQRKFSRAIGTESLSRRASGIASKRRRSSSRTRLLQFDPIPLGVGTRHGYEPNGPWPARGSSR